MPDTSVKYFHSAMPGAPTLNGTAGSLISVLDACLINGFGLKTIDSITVVAGVATANISTGHSLEISAVALIAGASVAALNGEQKVAATSTNTVKWSTSAADQTISNAGMTIKVAPANWLKAFTGANKAAYKSADPASTQQVMQVIDTAPQYAKVLGYEAMTDVDTGTGMFPNPAQQPGGFFWSKSYSSDVTARNWMLIADGRTLYFARGHTSAVLAYELSMFGDLVTTKSGDPFSAVITGSISDVSSGFATTYNQQFHSSSGVGNLYCSRGYTGYGAPAQMRRSYPTTGGSVDGYSGNNPGMPYPNAPDGGLYVVPWHCSESTGNLRGTFPGYWASPQNIPAGAFATRDSVVVAQGLPGKTLKALVITNTNYGIQSTSFFDITGPWR